MQQIYEILPPNLQDTEPTIAQLLAVTKRSYEKLEEMEDKITAINASLGVAKSHQQAAYENTLVATEAIEKGQMKLKSLEEQEMVIKEQLWPKERELHYLQQLQRQWLMRNNQDLKAVIENLEEEIEQLQANLLETRAKLESAREEIMKLRGQLRQARRELWASHSREQELERERAELQAEMNRERREVEHTLIQKAAALPTQEPVHEMMEVWLMHFTQHCSLADYIPPSVSSTSTIRQWSCSQKALGMR